MDFNVDAFTLYMQGEGLSDNTVLTYAGHIARYQAWCEASTGAPVQALYRENFLDFRSYLMHQRGLSPASVNQYIAALSKYNQFLIDRGAQQDVVIHRRDHVKVQASMTDPWDGEELEVAALRQAVLTAKPRYAGQNKRDYAIVTLMAHAGLRVSEAVALRLSDLSIENRQLRVQGKGGKTRIVFIGDKTAHALGAYLEVRGEPDSPYVFVSRQGPKLKRLQVNRILKKFSDTIHPHKLRHFYCSQTQKKAGFTLAETANQAGHASLKTTLRYTHPNATEMKAKVNKL